MRLSRLFSPPLRTRSLLEDLVFAEHERTEDAAHFLFAHERRAGHHFLEDRPLGIESVGAMLAEVTDLGVVAEVALALLKLDHAGQNLQQRGFCLRRSGRRARSVRRARH